jgi:GT2 family glycosyltransferase
MSRRLCALIVGYESGAFGVACARSILREWRALGGEHAELELVYVDNASPSDQEPWLAELAGLGVRVVRAGENLGYARGMNLALAEARSEAELVLVVNPDVVLLPGALAALANAADVPPPHSVGAVGPLASVDPLGQVLLPRNALPSPGELVRTLLVHSSAAYGRAYARTRLTRNLEWWGGSTIPDAELLSGACLLLPRAALRRLGGELFDPSFPLYFEDTDLCRRLRQLGLRLVHEPRARIVPHRARATGLALSDETQRRYAVGLERYTRKWHGALGARASVALTRRLSRLPPRPIHDCVELGRLARPLALELPRAGAWVLELALAPSFLLTAGVLGSGPRCALPERAWEWLFAARYFVRATERASGALLGAWTFEKTLPPRTEPLREDELALVEALA